MRGLRLLKDIVLHPTREELWHWAGALLACGLIILTVAFLRACSDYVCPTPSIIRPYRAVHPPAGE